MFEALGFTTNTLEETAGQIYQLIRLAGLLHDIGHLLYSHTFESLFEHEKDLVLLINQKKSLRIIS